MGSASQAPDVVLAFKFEVGRGSGGGRAPDSSGGIFQISLHLQCSSPSLHTFSTPRLQERNFAEESFAGAVCRTVVLTRLTRIYTQMTKFV